MESIKEILLLGLAEPAYSRVEFWQIKQKESGFSPVVFWIKLNEVWQQYHDFIEMKIKETNSWGNSVTDYGLSLTAETNMRLTGHLGREGLEDLRLSLYHYGFELKQNDWLYEYPEQMNRVQMSKEYCPSKQFALLDTLNIRNFCDELAKQEAEKIADFLDFHFRCYLRKIKKYIDYEALRESWLMKTQTHKPLNFSAKQRDCFFQWFEKLEQPKEEVATKEVDSEASAFSFTNNFDRITPIQIYEHFKNGLVKKGYLTEQDLIKYLKAAFEMKAKPETLFKIKDAPNKATIEAVFYTYYKNVAGKVHGKQSQYAALLGEYFEGYKTSTVSTNFSKSVY
jgi:hypothetical protein